MPKFRYSLDSGISWAVVDDSLPYSIPATSAQSVIVEPIGAAVELGVSAMNLAAYGLTDWTPGIGVNRLSANNYAPDKEADDLLTAFLATAGAVKTYYVNCSTYSGPGANGNSGTLLSPYLNLVTPVNLLPTELTIEVRVIPPPTRILWGTRGTLATAAPKRNLIIRADDGGELIIAGTSITSPVTWTANGDGTYTGSSGVTSATVSAPVDWSPEARVEQPDGIGRALTLTTGTTAANDAAIRAGLLPGQAYKNTATGTADITIRPFGDRAASVWQDYLIPCCPSANVFLLRADDNASDSPFYFVGRTFVTGGTPYIVQNRRTSVGGRGTVVLDRCGVVASTGSANGLAGFGAWLIQNYDWKSDATREDGLNIHAGTNSNAAWISGDCWAVHVRPKVNFVGLANSGTSNNQTEHENCRALTIMPTYRGGNGRTLASIDTSKGWVFGGSIGPSIRTTVQGYFETVSAGRTGVNGAQFVLVETAVSASPNGNNDIAADTGGTAFVHCYGMTQSALRVTGDVTFGPLL